MDFSSQGDSATVVFIGTLKDVDAFKPGSDGDPETSLLLQEALKAGLATRAVSVPYDPETSEVSLNPDLKIGPHSSTMGRLG